MESGAFARVMRERNAVFQSVVLAVSGIEYPEAMDSMPVVLAYESPAPVTESALRARASV
jgi:hypothetical protein